MKKATHWMLVLAGIAGLSLFGIACSPSGGGDDHGDHDHGDHEEHAEGGEGGGEQAAAAGAKKDAYPLEVCIVSGESLGSMGDPVSIQHEGMTVKFCCESCIEDFKEDPGKYLPKLTQAMGK